MIGFVNLRAMSLNIVMVVQLHEVWVVVDSMHCASLV